MSAGVGFASSAAAAGVSIFSSSGTAAGGVAAAVSSCVGMGASTAGAAIASAGCAATGSCTGAAANGLMPAGMSVAGALKAPCSVVLVFMLIFYKSLLKLYNITRT